MNDFILFQSLSFLQARDVISVCHANKRWNDVLSADNAATKELWKRVCENQECVSNTLMEMVQSIGIDMRLFAKGLGQSIRDDKRSVEV